MNISIVINGVKHVPCKRGNGCESCSLASYCLDELGSPCNDKIDHFTTKKERR